MKNNQEIIIVDSTLRDGSHAMRHQFTKKNISDYCQGAEKAGTKLVMVGHGNGLGASSLQLGRSLITDNVMLKTARQKLINTKLGAFLIPGFGTIQDDLQQAIEAGIDCLMVACHCSEATVTKQHIEYSVSKKLDTYGVLMMAHMISPNQLLEQAKLMESYGAQGVLIMDSAGTMLPQEITTKIKKLVKGLKIKIGFHAHNNFGMAITNSLTAITAGASIIDTTSRGLGAGAGNCQLEVLVAVLEKQGYKTNLNLYQLMDNAEKIIAPLMFKPQEIGSLELTSGLSGVFSGFAPHAKKASDMFGVDVRDIFIELGKRKAVAGQEDLIIDVASYLKNLAK